jgi:hypothetical protein
MEIDMKMNKRLVVASIVTGLTMSGLVQAENCRSDGFGGFNCSDGSSARSDGFGGYNYSDGSSSRSDGFGGFNNSNGTNCRSDGFGGFNCN